MVNKPLTAGGEPSGERYSQHREMLGVAALLVRQAFATRRIRKRLAHTVPLHCWAAGAKCGPCQTA